MKVDAEEVDIIYSHFGSMETIFNMIDEDENSLTKESLLGDFQKSTELLTEADKAILDQLCQNGAAEAESETRTLNAFGCIFYKKKYYWDDGLARLNFELSMGKDCPADGVIAEDLREKMEIERI